MPARILVVKQVFPTFAEPFAIPGQLLYWQLFGLLTHSWNGIKEIAFDNKSIKPRKLHLSGEETSTLSITNSSSKRAFGSRGHSALTGNGSTGGHPYRQAIKCQLLCPVQGDQS